MAQLEPESQKSRVSAIPYALSVSVLVIMLQSAWVVRGWSFEHNALLANIPFAILHMLPITLISFFIIRPFTSNPTKRRIVCLICVITFTVIINSLLPKVTS